ncbi:MAG: RAMP superfamily CRISPR-associated protein [Cyanobacteria bacterium J06634_5]
MIQLSVLNQPSAQTHQGNTIPLTALIDTALCVGAGGSSGSQADKPILKTAEGQLVIPASQLKGRLRHECEKLSRGLGWATCESPIAETMCPQRAGFSTKDPQDNDYENNFHRDDDYRVPGDERYHCLICQIFGNPALPAKLQISDLICVEPPENIPEVFRPGVTINRRRRTAEEKKLFFLETSPANTQLAFTGTITLAPNIPAFSKVLILAGLKHIHALGGSKSTGLGWLHWQSPLFDATEIDQNAWDGLDKAKVDKNAQQSTVAGGQS